MKRYAIIVAGGKGLRMGGDVPKQFLPINGKPVLMRTLEAFKLFDAEMQLIVVLPQEQIAYWQKLCRQHGCIIQHQVVPGGETRFHSVKNGLAIIPAEEDAVVGVHDGVRPFVSQEVLLPVIETIRKLNDSQSSKTVPRSEFRLVQTPQVFSVNLLKRAYEQPYTTAFTDDASVVEAMGIAVTLTEGNRENIKITTPFDLKIAEVLAK